METLKINSLNEIFLNADPSVIGIAISLKSDQTFSISIGAAKRSEQSLGQICSPSPTF
jgi:hypothetical protein